MKKGVIFLLLATLFFGCMKHESLYDGDKAREEAEKNFPVQNIDPNQDWVMSASRTLNVRVNEQTGRTYTIKVFNSYPFSTENDVRLLAQKDVKDGESATITFDAPLVLKCIYVMCQWGEEYIMHTSKLENEHYSVTFGKNEARSVESRTTVRAVDTSKYLEVAYNAVRIDKGEALLKLEKGDYYINTEITTRREALKLKSGVHLYIASGGTLSVEDKITLGNSDSFISVLEGGELIVKDDFSLDDKTASFYNAGTVNAEDVKIEKGIWINDASFSASGNFEVDGDDDDSDKYKPEVYNNCRLIINGEKKDEAFKLEDASFYNAGYVKVLGDAEWGDDAFVYLAGNAVFDIAKELDIDDDVTLTATGENTLIAAGILDFEDDVRVSGTINVSFENIDEDDEDDEDDNPPSSVNIISTTITDTGDCTVHSSLNPIPDVAAAVATYCFEDMVGEVTDYDFNDVVVHVSNIIDNKIKITLVAAGATNAITVQYSLNNGASYSDVFFERGNEVHAAFGKAVTEMINTHTSMTTTDSTFPSYEIGNVSDNFSFAANGRIRITVDGHTSIDSYNEQGKVPYSLSVPIAWAYPTERVRIDHVYEGFIPWGQGMIGDEDWYLGKDKENKSIN